MRSLFWKIFFSFLGSMALILGSVVLLTFYVAIDRFEKMEGVSPSTLMITAARVLETEGAGALRAWLHDNADLPEGVELLAIDRSGNELLGRPVPNHFKHRVLTRDSAVARRRHGGPPGPGPRVMAPDGRVFRLAFWHARLGPYGILGVGQTRWLILAVAMTVATLASLLLARYLSAPVRMLQGATRELASGNLAARAGPGIGARRDEIGVLGRDFDTMATRLESLLLAQRELLRNISHELRSPLARLSVALGLARRPGADVATQFDRIELETERLDALIGEVLRLASLAPGVQQLTVAPVAIEALVDGVVDDANFEAETTHRHVKREGGSALLINADADLLHSAVENVVRNAVRYTPEGGTVSVSLHGTDDMAVICVRDHGPGVPPEETGAIFEPFYRVAQARDRDSGGQGLGLAIAKACVTLHNGTLKARNAAGGGLEVEFRLPASGAKRDS